MWRDSVSGPGWELGVGVRARRRFTWVIGLLGLFLVGCGKDSLTDAMGVAKVSREEADFGTVFLGERSYLDVRISNGGQSILKYSVERAPHGFSVVQSTGSAGPFEDVSVQLVFSPGSEGVQEGEVVLRFSGARNPLATIQVKGVGIAYAVETVDEVDFGLVAIDGQAVRDLAIRNVSDLPRNIEFKMEGEDGGSFLVGGEARAFASGDEAVVRLTFTPRSGTRSESAHLFLSCDGCPTRKVRLIGRGIVPQLHSTPSVVRFGGVAPGRSREESTRLKNVGKVPTGPLGLRWSASSSGEFTLGSTSLGNLEPGEETNFGLTFRAGHTLGNRVGSLLVVAESGRQLLEIPVEGWSGGAALAAIPPSVHMVAPVNWKGKVEEKDARSFSKVITVRNHGDPSPITLAPSLVGVGSNDFVVVPQDGLVLGPGGALRFLIEFYPTREGERDALLMIRGGADTLEVPLSGWGNLPSPSCPSSMKVRPNVAVSLVGKDVSVMGGGSCWWSVVDAPPGSEAIPEPQDACGTTFLPDFVGKYVAELEITDVAGNRASCSTTLDVVPTVDLWIETFWTNASDVDLHLLNVGLADPEDEEAWKTDADCHFHNCTKSRLEWGSDPGNHPLLDRDDMRGRGPENIEIPRASLEHSYAIGLRWYTSLWHPTNDVTTNVYCFGTLEEVIHTTLEPGNGVYVLGEILFDETSCTYTPLDFHWDGSVPGDSSF